MTRHRRRKILLVEDEVVIAMAEKLSLEEFGYEVVIAHSGEKSVDAFRRDDAIDLVLMDIDLGEGLDGTEAAVIMLREREIPVVFLSSHVEPEVVERTEKITSYGYVVKNSGTTVLDASIKMAFKLFEANRKTEIQKEQLKTILHSIGDAVIATDTDGKIIQMNPVAESLTGWSFDEAAGKPLGEVFTIVSAQTRGPVKNPIDAVLSSGEIVGLAKHTLLLSREGSEHQIADSGSPIVDSNGEITGVVLVFRDVTREYEIRERIEESERLYRSLFENMLDAYSYCKMVYSRGEPSDFVFLATNKAFEKATGLGEVAGRRASEAIPGIWEADPELFEIFARVASTGSPERSELRIVSLKMWAAVSVFSPQRDFVGVVFDDITERKRAEEELRNSQGFLMSVIEQSPFSTWISDARGTMVKMNQACRDMLNIKDEEVVGKYRVLDDEIVRVQGHMPLVEKVFEEGETASFELTYDSSRLTTLRLDSTVSVILDVTIFPIKNAKGIITNAVIQHNDVTERKRVEAALRASERRLGEMLRDLDRRLSESEYAQLWNVYAQSRVPTLTVRDSGEIVDINQAMVELTGYSRAEVPDVETLVGLLFPDESRRREAGRKFRGPRGKGRELTQEAFVVTTKGGGERYVVVSVYDVMHQDRPTEVRVIQAEDLTEQKRMERALRDGEQK